MEGGVTFRVNIKVYKGEYKMIKGKDKFIINDNLTVGIYDNGMHYAQIKDNKAIQSVILRKTSNEIYKELKERKII